MARLSDWRTDTVARDWPPPCTIASSTSRSAASMPACPPSWAVSSRVRPLTSSWLPPPSATRSRERSSWRSVIALAPPPVMLSSRPDKPSATTWVTPEAVRPRSRRSVMSTSPGWVPAPGSSATCSVSFSTRVPMSGSIAGSASTRIASSSPWRMTTRAAVRSSTRSKPPRWRCWGSARAGVAASRPVTTISRPAAQGPERAARRRCVEGAGYCMRGLPDCEDPRC